MPDRDIPEPGPDPMDEAYLRAEHVLDDEDARAARRAKVLAAVAQAPAAPSTSARRPVRRYGGWLAAACVAGLSVWTAQRVYRSTPPPQQPAPQGTPAAVTTSAVPTSPALNLPKSPAPAAQPPSRRARAARASAIAPPVLARPPVAPPPDIAPPPPLPIPPVEKPIAPSPPPAPIASLSVNVPAPAPPQAPAPVAAAKAGAAEPGANTELQSVVITGSRIARRDYSASSPAISQPQTDASQVSDAQSRMLEARSKMLEARSRALGARLHYDVAAGRIADIEPALAEGAPVDAADESGETPLMRSIQTGQSEVAALLRRHGASLDLKNHAGVSARDMATAKNDPTLNRALGLTP